MLIDHLKIFDEAVEGTTAVYTAPPLVQRLGAVAGRKVFAAVSGVSGTSPTLTVELEHAGSVDDSRYWRPTTGTPIINNQSISTSAITILRGFLPGAAPHFAFTRARVQLGGTTPKAHVCIYLTSRQADPATFAPGTFVVYNELVFDEFLDSTTSVYTRPDANPLIGLTDAIGIHAIAAISSGTSPTLTVQLEDSPDNINWINKAGTPEINVQPCNVGTITNLTGWDTGATPFGGYTRARIQLGGSSLKGRVKVWFTGRGQRSKAGSLGQGMTPQARAR